MKAVEFSEPLLEVEQSLVSVVCKVASSQEQKAVVDSINPGIVVQYVSPCPVRNVVYLSQCRILDHLELIQVGSTR
jgi:hypothetical protein